jgi:hypothetical protein
LRALANCMGGARIRLQPANTLNPFHAHGGLEHGQPVTALHGPALHGTALHGTVLCCAAMDYTARHCTCTCTAREAPFARNSLPIATPQAFRRVGSHVAACGRKAKTKSNAA